MSSNSLCAALLCVFLVLQSCLHVSFAGRSIPSSAPSTVVRPLAAEDIDDRDRFGSLRPRLSRPTPGAAQFAGCLPKGFRRTSAPSRFVNYHTLRSAGCNPDAVRDKKP